MQRPEHFISVCMAHYNKGALALEAVQSVLAQDYPYFELVLVDDASTDGSAQALQALADADERMHFIDLGQRVGAAAARNRALHASRGTCIFFMDSDDLMVPGGLWRMAREWRSSQPCRFIAFPMDFFHNQPGDSPQRSTAHGEGDALTRFFERRHPWLLSGPLWERDFLLQLGGFTEGLLSQQDFDLHVRALMEQPKYRFVRGEAVCLYRQDVLSEPRQLSQSLEALRQRAHLLKSYLPTLAERGLRTAAIDKAIADYLLDLALMMRWHKHALGHTSTQEGLLIWMQAYEHGLVDARTYSQGMGYIRFKHNMLWNRLPKLQHLIEQRYQRRLRR